MIANSSELRRASVSSSRNVDRSRLATARNSLSPMPWPSESLTALKLSMPSTSNAALSVLRHEGEPRFGALALGDVHQRQQHRGLVAIHQVARIDRQIDQCAVGPHV